MENRQPALCHRWWLQPWFWRPAHAVRGPGSRTGACRYTRAASAEDGPAKPEALQIGVDAGGYFNYAYFTYNAPPPARTARLTSTTCASGPAPTWTKRTTSCARSDQLHGLGPRTTIPSIAGDDFVNPTVERAWYEFDLAGLIRAQHKAPENDLRVKVGRDFMEIGTDLVLAHSPGHGQGHMQLGNWSGWPSSASPCLTRSTSISPRKCGPRRPLLLGNAGNL